MLNLPFIHRKGVKTLLLLLLSVSMFSSCKKDEETPIATPTPTVLSNEQKVLELFNVISTGNPAGLVHISDAQYIQHNPFMPDGKEALVAMFNGSATGITVTNHRIFSDGDIVVAHSTYGGVWNGGVPQVAFDVFRFENGLIVEHWDNLQNESNPQIDAVNLYTQTNGVTIISSGTSASNLALVTNMVNNVLIAGQWSTKGDYFSTEYMQHSPGVPNGIDWMDMFADGTPFYSALKYVYGEGDFVLSMSEGPEFVDNMPTGNSKAYYDLFRIENGLVIEHWDVVSVIPPSDAWLNDNGKW